MHGFNNQSLHVNNKIDYSKKLTFNIAHIQ